MAVDNLKLQRQLNEAIERQANLLREVNSALTTQLKLQQQLAGTRSDTSFARDAIDDASELASALRQAREEARRTGMSLDEAFADIADRLEETAGGSEKIADALTSLAEKSGKDVVVGVGFAAVALDSFMNLAKGIPGVLSVVTGAFSHITDIVWGLSKTLIALPFNIFGKVVDMALAMPGGTKYLQELESTRKAFGTFEEDISRNVMGAYHAIQGRLAETGLSVWRVLGDWGERLQYVRELAEGMGATFHQFGDEVVRNAEAIVAYQKGLGISNDAMRAMAQLATRTGRSLSDVLNEVTLATTDMADRFGVSHKVISRDVSEMTKDVANFGSMTTFEMARASVYVRKLGLEVKEVLGVIKAYDNFEDAARGAANLAQAFGANVDALAMMREQDPSKRIDMLRQAFARAGVDAEKMTRQELALLAQQTGLSEEAAKAAFSLKNQGISMKELEAQQARSERKTMTQQEAMLRLAKSIELVVKSGITKGGFWRQFVEGFQAGVKWAGPFRRMLFSIRYALRETYWAGFRLGQLFVRNFPGISKIVRGVTEVFQRARFRQMLNAINAAFTTFFRTVSQSPAAVGRLFDRLRAIFLNFLGDKTGAGSKVLGGLREFGNAILNTLRGVIREVLPRALSLLADLVKALADFIRDPSAFVAAAKTSGGALGGVVGTLVDDLMFAFMSVAPKLKEAFGELLGVLKVAVKEEFGSFLKEYGVYLGVVFAPAVVKMLAGTVGTIETLWKASKKTTKFGMGVVSSLLDVLPGVSKLGNALKGVLKFATKLGGKLLIIPAIADGLMNVASVAESVGEKLDRSYDESARNAAMIGVGIVNMLTFGFLSEETLVKVGNALSWLFDKVLLGIKLILGEKVLAVVKFVWDGVFATVRWAGDMLNATFSGDWSRLKDLALKPFTSMYEGIRSLFTSVGEVVLKGVRTALVAARDLFEKVGMGDLVDGYITSVDSAIAKLQARADVVATTGPGAAASAWRDIAERIRKSDIGRAVDAMYDRIKTEVVAKAADQKATDKLLSMLPAYNAVKDIDPAEVERTVAGFRTLKPKLEQLVETIATMNIGTGAVAGVERTSAVVGGIDMVVKSLSSVTRVGVPTSRAITSRLERLTASLSSFSSGVNYVFGRGAVAGITEQTVANVKVVQRRHADVNAAVEGIVASVADTYKALSDVKIPAGKVSVKLRNLADKLGIDGEKFTIENEKIQVEVPVTVVLEADSIAYALDRKQYYVKNPGRLRQPRPSIG